MSMLRIAILKKSRNCKLFVMVGATALMCMFLFITVFAAQSIPNVRLVSTYDPVVGTADENAVSIKSNLHVFDIDYKFDTEPESYKIGDPVGVTVVLTVKDEYDGEYDFKDIKIGSCKLDELNANDMQISEDLKTLTLKFEIPALTVQLDAPVNLTFDRFGNAKWSKVNNADSYYVVLQKMNDMGKRVYVDAVTTRTNSCSLYDLMYIEAGDYLYTVRASSDLYWFSDSETAELPLSNSILLTQDDIGLSPDRLTDDGRVFEKREPITNKEVRIAGKDYYFGDDGYRITGWLRDDSGWKYYDENTFEKVRGLTEIEGEKYYFDDDGYMQCGFVTLPNGNEMFFSQSGIAITGWVKWNENIYYISKDGSRHTSQLIDRNGKTYLFKEDGRLVH